MGADILQRSTSICSLKKAEAKELESLIERYRQFLDDIATQWREWRDGFDEKNERWQGA